MRRRNLTYNPDCDFDPDQIDLDRSIQDREADLRWPVCKCGHTRGNHGGPNAEEYCLKTECPCEEYQSNANAIGRALSVLREAMDSTGSSTLHYKKMNEAVEILIGGNEGLPSIEDAKQWKRDNAGYFISPELEHYVAKLMSDYAMEVLARFGYFDGRDHKGEVG